jgi:hypothetical protein
LRFGNRVAVGYSGYWHAIAATETGGIWAQATEVNPPANADGHNAFLNGVSCPSVGNCVGVGE